MTLPDAEVLAETIILMILNTQSSSSSQKWASKAQINMRYSITVLSDFGGQVFQL